MLSSIALTTLRAAAVRAGPMVTQAPIAQAAAARYATQFSRRFMSAKPFAVDAPDGDHDLQDLEESGEWAKRTVTLASALEDTAAINAMHDAVLGKTVFAVDAPDGEHDLEDVEEHMNEVDRIIEEASMFENPEDVREQQHLREECLKQANRTSEHDF
mmetsp:Transcript_10884/g.24043  ORF Transcript_10884/g.24043 Transcript_10884/m.24043 type:complete len:158 (+) Transcript_10884:143-616(+)|eukprot:CAMPEP_0172297514 /NCGR_PEP_ID=MMETSP1058-20130122/506_1 /TAXON_ID=83371 /ORGANISM="Detonula confervacea, Strain CCMP 353" /LENGTH=157 /DNA_ID=CAMNT_0013006675 /DNA_START=141 /DNA_END=614 /DNA_ORIENTATION=-